MMEDKKTAQKLKEEVKVLERQNLLLQDLQNLQNEAFWRQQVLILMERIARALETSLEDLEKEKNKE